MSKLSKKFKVVKDFVANYKVFRAGETYDRMDFTEKLEEILEEHGFIKNMQCGYPFLPKEGEWYYCYCTALSMVLRQQWLGGTLDYDLFMAGNCFGTKKEAVEWNKKRAAWIKIKSYIIEHCDIWESKWPKEAIDKNKYYIFCDVEVKKFEVIGFNAAHFTNALPFFKCKKQAEKVIKKFLPELKLIYDLEGDDDGDEELWS
jgi:hypothetical protein